MRSPHAFPACIPPRRDSCQLRMCKGKIPDRTTQNIARRGLSIETVEESRSGVGIRMPPTVDHDTSDVALGIETGVCKERDHLPTDLSLEFPVTRGVKFRARHFPLFRERQPALGEGHVEGE